MIDPICKREITPAMLARDLAQLEELRQSLDDEGCKWLAAHVARRIRHIEAQLAEMEKGR